MRKDTVVVQFEILSQYSRSRMLAMKTSVRLTGVPADIWTEILPNASHERQYSSQAAPLYIACLTKFSVVARSTVMQQKFLLVLQSGNVVWFTFRIHFIRIEKLTVVAQDLSLFLTHPRVKFEEVYWGNLYHFELYLQVQLFLLFPV
jgi:hypothetical protein